MLLYFTIKNSRSFEQEATLSFIAGNENELPQNFIDVPKYNIRVLKTAIIYGANASGKSNLLKAMADGLLIMGNGLLIEKQISVESLISATTFNAIYFPNRNNDKNLKSPTTYKYGFILENEKYEYTFTNDANRILEEKLLHFIPNEKHPITIYQRIFLSEKNDNGWYFNKKNSWGEEADKIVDASKVTISKSQLWLSEVAKVSQEKEHKVVFIENIYNWFLSNFNYYIDIKSPGEKDITETIIAIYKDKKLKEHFLSLLKIADFKIQDISIELQKQNGRNRLQAHTLHKSVGEDGKRKNIKYDLISENSTGTLRFLAWLLPFYETLINGKILIIDEFGNSIHPLLTEFMIQLFHDKKRSAQLIFSTHYTELMSRTLFRDEQILLINRNEDGNSSIVPLSYYNIPPNILLDKIYLQGVLNAVPNILFTPKSIQKILANNAK